MSCLDSECSEQILLCPLPVPNNVRYDYEYRLQNIFSGLNRTFQPQCIGL